MARTPRGLTIGELARRTAVPVKTLRFYSDEGLLPPAGRSASGYRLYDDDAALRVELIRTLRDAGLGLERVRAVLARELSLADALRLQLAAVEAHLASLKHVASALRAALRSEPTEHDLRRLYAVTKLSNEERKAVVEGFYEKVAEGSSMSPGWRRAMVEASAPELPDDPSPEQLDAWVELSQIVNDASFLATMRQSVQQTWTPAFDVEAYQRAAATMMQESKGLDPQSAEAKAVVERCLAGFAAAAGEAPDEGFRRSLRARYEQQDPRATRYWQLVAVLKGRPPAADPSAEWRWFAAASKYHFP